MKRLIYSFCILAAVFASASCSAKTDTSKADEKPVITIVVPDNSYGLSTDPSLQEQITAMIEEKANVTVEAVIPPLASFTDKLATLINSGDIPDVFIASQAMARIPQMVAREQVLDLTNYIQNSDVLSQINKALIGQLEIDGALYAVPYSFSRSKAIYLRKDLMEQYGINLSNTPTTEAFRTEMSKLVGTGVTPFCFPKWVDNFQYFYNSFGAWGGVMKKDGMYLDGFQTEEMQSALTYIRQLYTDGILNKEFITTENSHMRELTYSAMAASDIDYVTNYINYVQNTRKAEKETDMHLIYKLVGPNGDGGTLNEAIQTAFAVSSRTKNPDAAVRVIEAIVGDRELYQAFFGIGLEGHHYTLDDAGAITPTNKAANSGYKYTFNFLSDAVFPYDISNLSFTLDEGMKSGIKVQGEKIRESIPNMGPNHNADVPVGLSVAYDRVAPSIKSTRESIATKIVVGSVSVEDGMKEYVNFWKSINGDEILKELNASK